jgi:hypothetical protein
MFDLYAHTARWPSALACAATIACFFLLGHLSSPAQAAAETTCPPSSSSTTSATPPSTPDAQPQTAVACIGSQAITEATFQHWRTVAQAEPSSEAGHALSAAEVTTQVMGFLISGDWVIGEARDLNVHVSPAEVRRTFNRTRKTQFPKQSEFQAFLGKSKETVADILLRVELDLLSQRLQRHVVAGEHGAREKQQALKHFVSDFRKKWTAQTYCAAQYASRDCGHVQPTL